MTDTIEIRVSDIEDVRQVLAACYGFLYARDIQEAQIQYQANRPSALTAEVERVKTRFDGYFQDFLLAEHEARLAEDRLDDQDTEDEPEDGAEDVTEVLSGSPLGAFTPPTQEGTRVDPRNE
jgi:hypothetical protein